MGSSFSVLNDTKRDVWVQQGTQWTVVMATVGAVASVLTFGAAAAGVAAGVAGTTALIGTMEGIIVGEIAIAGAAFGVGVTGWTVTSAVLGLSTAALATALNITSKEAEKLQKVVKNFMDNSTMIKPGEKFYFTGSLSLVRSVTAMNDRLQMDNRDCWTHALNQHENKYTISVDFSNLMAEIPKM